MMFVLNTILQRPDTLTKKANRESTAKSGLPPTGWLYDYIGSGCRSAACTSITVGYKCVYIILYAILISAGSIEVLHYNGVVIALYLIIHRL